jgi:hypothetical protein
MVPGTVYCGEGRLFNAGRGRMPFIAVGRRTSFSGVRLVGRVEEDGGILVVLNSEGFLSLFLSFSPSFFSSFFLSFFLSAWKMQGPFENIWCDGFLLADADVLGWCGPHVPAPAPLDYACIRARVL